MPHKLKIMKSIIEKSLTQSYSYPDYRAVISALIKEGKSTGHIQTEELVNYSELNETRMNRLDKTLIVPDENIQKLQSFSSPMIWLVLSEGWCGDAAQIVPILNKMAETSKNITLKIVLRDDNDALMQHFLTNEAKSIPKLIVLDAETLEVLTHWGPRPAEAKQLILDYKAAHGVVDEPAKIELQKWYLHDKGLSTQEEILTAIAKIPSQKLQA